MLFSYIRIKEEKKVNELIIQFKKLEQRTINKPKEIGRQEIIKIRGESVKQKKDLQSIVLTKAKVGSS